MVRAFTALDADAVATDLHDVQQVPLQHKIAQGVRLLELLRSYVYAHNFVNNAMQCPLA